MINRRLKSNSYSKTSSVFHGPQFGETAKTAGKMVIKYFVTFLQECFLNWNLFVFSLY